MANTAATRRTPWVTYILIGLNTIIWALSALLPGPDVKPTKDDNVTFYQLYTKYRQQDFLFGISENKAAFLARLCTKTPIPVSLVDQNRAHDVCHKIRIFEASRRGLDHYLTQEFGFIPRKGVTVGILTSIFLHGGFLHLLMNMLFLFIVGCNMEDTWGRWKYLLFYLSAGILANLAHWASDPGSHLPLVGASGAVSGVMGAFLIFHARTRIRFFYWFFFFIGSVLIPAYFVLPVWFLIQLINAISPYLQSSVAYWAHIGGFLFGILIALGIRLIWGMPPPLPEKVRTRPKRRDGYGSWDWTSPMHRDTDSAREVTPMSPPRRSGLPPIEPIPLEEIHELIERLVLETAKNPRKFDLRWHLLHAYLRLGRRREAVAVGEKLMADLMAAGKHNEARQVYGALLSQ